MSQRTETNSSRVEPLCLVGRFVAAVILAFVSLVLMNVATLYPAAGWMVTPDGW